MLSLEQMWRAAILLLSLSACVVRLDPDKATQISCRVAGDCPNNLWSCVNGFCLHKDVAAADVPTVSVSYLSPADKKPDVPVNALIIVAFNFDVDAESLVDRLSLTPAGGAALTLTATPTSLANTFELAPGALLPQTDYVFTVSAGVAPVTGINAAPSTAAFTSAFHTADAPDTTAPAPIATLVVTRTTSTRVLLTWSEPADIDYAGVLILRKANGVITEAPSDGTTYAIGAEIGGATVIASVDGAEWDDVTVGGDPADYALFAFDRASNYAEPVRAPFISTFDLSWCPTHTGTVHVGSPDSGTYRLQVANGPGAVTGVLWPPAAVALAMDAPLTPGAPFDLGAQRFVRLIAENSGGRFVGTERSFWVSNVALTPSTIAPDVLGVGVTASMQFDANGWPAFASEVDDEMLPNGPSGSPGVAPDHFVPITDSGGLPIAKPTSAGTYRFRVKPVVLNCADAAWTESAEFTFGVARFVRQGGTGNGSSPAQAAGSIDATIAGAATGTDIYVAGGLYSERVNVLPGRRVFGGFNNPFTARDRIANPTTIRAALAAGQGLVRFSGSVTPTTIPLFDGFIVDATMAGNVIHYAVQADISASITNNTITAGGVFDFAGADEKSEALRMDNCHDGIIAKNTITATSDISAGIHMLNSLRVTIEDNVISGVDGIEVDSGSGDIRGNTVRYPVDSRVIDRNMVTLAGVLTFEGNDLIEEQDVPGLTNGLVVGGSFKVTARRNRISGGGGDLGSRGVYFSGTNDLFLYANMISAGRGRNNRFAVDSNPTLAGMMFAANNTIHAGTRMSDVGMTFAMGTNSGLVAVNNLLFGTFGWGGFVEQQAGPSSDYADAHTVDNNVFIGTPSEGLYVGDNETSGSYPAPTAITPMEALLHCGNTPAAGNVSLPATTPAQVFVDVDGGDNDIETLLDNDWRLLGTASASIRTGGSVGPSGPAGGCGVSGSTTTGTSGPTGGCAVPARGGFSCGLEDATDFAGTPRTGQWSVGAFEAP
ncbi:MAG: right-handed parallel beta-helix repeat-containing protein [Deltaproteobacteria bacterium]|nr:right-handed parallel beta-helix repeat-containing protein [Deltaproteobacteria bacterium]